MFIEVAKFSLQVLVGENCNNIMKYLMFTQSHKIKIRRPNIAAILFQKRCPHEGSQVVVIHNQAYSACQSFSDEGLHLVG